MSGLVERLRLEHPDADAVPTTEYQVVYAPDRGDTCYAGKRGWWYHRLDEARGIIPESLRGPFDSADLAVEGIRNAL